MPHIIVECSDNLARLVPLDGVVRSLHEAALATGVFPPGGTRTRVHVSRHYRIADGNPQHVFIHVQMRIARGRDVATRKRAAEQVFSALRRAMAPAEAATTVALSLEIAEIDSDTEQRFNTIHKYMETRPATGTD
jgi:5-carboxymethyl-2-hydroxymuconate isomerase